MPELRPKNPSDVLQSYRRWKEEGESLKAEAQGFLVERFHELVQEAQQVQADLWEDFGHSVKFPANPKLVKKGKGRAPAKKAAASARPGGKSSALTVAAAPAVRPAPAVHPSDAAREAEPSRAPAPQVRRSPLAPARKAPAPRPAGPEKAEHAGSPRNAEKLHAQLERQVEKAKQRLAEAQASGSSVKIQNAEDRLYELTDELRLMLGNRN